MVTHSDSEAPTSEDDLMLLCAAAGSRRLSAGGYDAMMSARDRIRAALAELTHPRAALDPKAVVLGEGSGVQQKTQAVVAAAVGWFNAPDSDDDAIGHLAAHLGLVNALEEGGFIPAPEDDVLAPPDTVKL